MEGHILEMKHISKDYEGIHALLDVSFNLKKGEALYPRGKNGTGKPTLTRILTGVEKPSKGEIYPHGRLAHINRPIDAYRQGISIAHQELVQTPDMTIVENIFVGRCDRKKYFIGYKTLTGKTNRLVERLGIHYNPGARIRQYPVAQKRLTEIMKALSYDSSIIVLDEPMAALVPDGTKMLYDIIRKLKQEGVSIIFISHRMEDIYAVGSRVYVLKDGRYPEEAMVEDVTVEDIIKMVTGRGIGQQFVQKTSKPGEAVPEVRNLTSRRVKDVSFQVRPGEVVGFDGLIEAGRAELSQAIHDVDNCEGEIYHKGKPIKNTLPKVAIDRGLSIVLEDRRDKGLILSHPVQNNIQMTILDRISKMGLLSGKKGEQIVGTFIENLSIKTSEAQQRIGMLSGDSQQKVALAKCMVSGPSVILLDELTHGVDMGAKTEMYKIIDNLAGRGFAIIMVLSELPELVAISSRIIVMREGRMSGETNIEAVTGEQVITLAIQE